MAIKQAVLAGGCFWGMEELFRKEPGVLDTEVGYTGGRNENPTYESHPGHAEALRISYDDTVTSYAGLLDFFFRIHDPTTINRQGNDVGSSYRSAIFYADDEEKQAAERLIEVTNAAGLYKKPVVTTLEPLGEFYPAEDYHQDYLQKHPGGYTCHYLRRAEPLSSGS
jgi:peptide-methionine (S)-S-oxide reductase